MHTKADNFSVRTMGLDGPRQRCEPSRLLRASHHDVTTVEVCRLCSPRPGRPSFGPANAKCMAAIASHTTVVVTESFNITNRGAAAVFVGAWERIPVGRPLHVLITPPDGAAFHARAFMELILRRRPGPVESGAVLVSGRSKHEVPPGSHIRLPLLNAGAAASLAEIALAFRHAPLPEAWKQCDSPQLARELAREVTEGHLLFGEDVETLAKADGRDEVLFATRLLGAPLVAVHLTYRQETTPDWPRATPLSGVEEWLQYVQDSD